MWKFFFVVFGSIIVGSRLYIMQSLRRVFIDYAFYIFHELIPYKFITFLALLVSL